VSEASASPVSMSPVMDSIKHEYEKLDFDLEYRVALQDGQIKENREISPDTAQWLEKVSRFYLLSSSDIRQEIRALFDDDDKLWHLFVFVENQADMVTAQDDRDSLELALAALSIEDGRYDTRDSAMLFHKLCRKAIAAGIDMQAVAEEVAALSTPSMRDMLLRVGK
jgi:hypothetical protein